MKKDKLTLLIEKIIRKLKLSKQKEAFLIQFTKFIIISGTATIIDWILYYLLYNYCNLEPLIANIISFSISTIYNYLLSIKYVFVVNKENSKKKNFIIFITTSMMALLLSEGLLYLMINILSLNKMLAKVIATIIVMIFNFVTKKIFLEKKN